MYVKIDALLMQHAQPVRYRVQISSFSARVKISGQNVLPVHARAIVLQGFTSVILTINAWTAFSAPAAVSF